MDYLIYFLANKNNLIETGTINKYWKTILNYFINSLHFPIARMAFFDLYIAS